MREWLDELEARTKRFAVASVRFAQQLERLRTVPRSVVWQFVACSTSVGANHRAARRARSDRELVAKLGLVLEEADEAVFWLELVEETVTPPPAGHVELIFEARELRAIFARSCSSARARLARKAGT
jgi:four helix bundle protein